MVRLHAREHGTLQISQGGEDGGALGNTVPGTRHAPHDVARDRYFRKQMQWEAGFLQPGNKMLGSHYNVRTEISLKTTVSKLVEKNLSQSL